METAITRFKSITNLNTKSGKRNEHTNLCIIRANMLQQFAKINPTLPKIAVNNHETKRNPTDNIAIQ